MESIVHFLALIILLSVFLFWHFSKRLNLYSETVFRGIILYNIFFTSLDYINCHDLLRGALVGSEFKYNFAISFYIFIPVLYAYLCTLYLLVGSMGEKKHRKISHISAIAPVINFLCFFFMKDKAVTIDQSNSKIFVGFGTATILVIVFAAIYFSLIIGMLIANRKTINRWKIINTFISASSFIIGIKVQYVNGSIGGIAVSSALCIMIYLIANENPLIYVNKNYDCFKQDYLLPYLNRLFELKKPCFIYSVSIETKNNVFVNDNQAIKNLIKDIIKKNRPKKGCRLFISDDLNLTIVSTDINNYQKELLLVQNYVLEYLSKNNLNINLVPIIIAIENSTIAASAELLIGYFNTALSDLRANTKALNGDVFTINEDYIKQCENEKEVIDMIILALNEDRVKIFIQPIYSTQKDAFISGEVLVRIADRQGGIIPPYKFIPVAEKRGIIEELDNRVLEKTCQLFNEINPKELGVEYLDVNLSVAQCQIPNYSDKLIAVTQKYNITPDLINFEITESGFLEDVDALIDNVTKLTNYGFRFSLDDFGNGESNLNYLVTMPVTNVKLDMTMTRAYFENPNANKIVKTITNISHNMNLKIVAEGVENKDQLKEMENIKIDYIQGYCFYKPMPAEEYKQILYDFAKEKKERKAS